MTLQRDLDTSESVQKDFVKLSQDLQIQLEKIRQSDQVGSNQLVAWYKQTYLLAAK